MSTIAKRCKALDWAALDEHFDERGYATVPGLLSEGECSTLRALYAEQKRFRKRIVMQHKGYGRGEYQYFDYPLPKLVGELRRRLYGPLSAVANRWRARLGDEPDYPGTLNAYLDRCRSAGQRRPTPLLLRYGQGDYNCLHQDLYGEHAFPLQTAILLSEPGRDFSGGEFLLTEQRPRAQARPQVVPLTQGDMVIFAVAQRPAAGVRGFRKVNMRHGVSEVTRGERYTLGIIFHDAA